MDDGCSGFLIILLANPHGLESGEGGENGATDPDKELSFLWGKDFNFHG